MVFGSYKTTNQRHKRAIIQTVKPGNIYLKNTNHSVLRV